MTTPVENPVCIVTGASAGIGKAICQELANSGTSLAMCARDLSRLEDAAESLPAETERLLASVDVANSAAVQSFVQDVITRFGRIDLLVNNAGAFDGGPVETLSDAAWSQVIGTCLSGAFYFSRAVFPTMREQGSGRILNIGSISGRRSREGNAAYTSAKFGVRGLTEALAIEGRPLGITVSCLNPGNVGVERRLASSLEEDAEPMMSPDVIAKAAIHMLTVPPDVNFLDATILPRDQDYLGRG